MILNKLSDFKLATIFAVLFFVFFFILQKIGLVNLIGAKDINYVTAFLIGIIASLSTCMATVGGLVLSVSASFAKEGNKVRPQIMFHLGRLISFFFLGGFIGLIGSAFTLTTTTSFILSILIALVMFVLGLKLLNIFSWTKFLWVLPKSFADNIKGLTQLNSTLTPILIGIATFFLPCGFTQSMQIYTLSTGGFLAGALTMFFFALGTLPVLAIISFSSIGFKTERQSSIFFKTSGIIILAFALLNFISALVVIGWISPFLNI